MGGRREVSVISHRPVTRSDLKQERSVFLWECLNIFAAGCSINEKINFSIQTMVTLQAKNLSTKLVKSFSSHCLGAHIPHCIGNCWNNRKEKSYS